MFVSAVVGRVIRVHDGDPEAKEMKEYTIAPGALITINGRKRGLADLDTGDEVVITNGGGKGFERVTATRDKNAHGPVAGPVDLSRPRLVELVTKDEAENPVVATRTIQPPPVSERGDKMGHKRGGADKPLTEVGANTGIDSPGEGGDETAGDDSHGPIAGRGAHSIEATRADGTKVDVSAGGHSGQKPGGTHVKAAEVPGGKGIPPKKH